MYGPITTLRRDNRVVKHIPWSAFKMTDADWNRVIDARDILGVHISKPLIFIWIETDTWFRTRIASSSASLWRNNPLFGAPFQLSKNYKWHGRRNATAPDLPSIRMLSLMVSQSWRNITHGSTRSQVSCWHSVWFCSSYFNLFLTNLFTVLHPYYKLAYIKLSWGGEEEKEAEIAVGNLDVKDWHDEANKLIEKTVRSTIPFDMSYHTNASK